MRYERARESWVIIYLFAVEEANQRPATIASVQLWFSWTTVAAGLHRSTLLAVERAPAVELTSLSRRHVHATATLHLSLPDDGEVVQGLLGSVRGVAEVTLSASRDLLKIVFKESVNEEVTRPSWQSAFHG